MTTPQKPAKPTTWTPDPELRERLDEYAKRNRQSMNAAMHILLTHALDREEVLTAVAKQERESAR